MAAWGGPGGGPLTTQQVDNLIDYLWSVQLTPEEMATQVDELVEGIDPGPVRAHARGAHVQRGRRVDPLDANRLSTEDEIKLGEILFNNQELAAGSYSCARCHVRRRQPTARPGSPSHASSTASFGPDLIGHRGRRPPSSSTST